jgi:uncharacterized membrane protein
VSQGVFVLLESLRSRSSHCQRQSRETRCKINAYLLAILATALLYSPWLLVLLNNYQRALETTNWTKDQFNLLYLVKLWILSFTSLFIDLDLGFNSLWNYLLRLPFLILIFMALHTVYRQTNSFTFLFIITSITVPFLLLAIPDLLFSNQRSAVTRYLIACFPGIQLAVAYFLATKLMQYKAIAYFIFAALITASIVSCSLNAVSETSWSKLPSYFNGEIARRINSSVPVIVLSDRGDDFTNIGDLISLSYFLSDRVQLFLLSYPSHRANLNHILEKKQTNFLVFRPSKAVKAVLEQEKKILEPFFPEGNLWRLRYRLK